ncbi:MAG: hypothetical protein OQK24_10855 [Magnetovibrio sp.]|nr:hypothetical protein [Magnetovibrio sp.]
MSGSQNSSFFRDIILAFHIARRDLRGILKGRWRTLALLVAGVFIGVGSIALVGAGTEALRDGARKGALESIGGDLSFRLFHRTPSSEEFSFISQFGQTTLSAELRPMARAGDQTTLVELKGVDGQYPLYGTITTDASSPLSELLKNDGAVADAALFDQLGLSVGDDLVIGQKTYHLRAKLLNEPDRAFRAFTLGPRVMVSVQSLAATGLVEPGAEAYFYTRVKISKGKDATQAMKRIDERFPQSGWRMVNAQSGVPGVERTLAMAHVLLLFIGLGVMLVGGAGISGAVRAHLDAKMDTIAILKSVGTPPNVITLALGIEVLGGAALGALVGIGLGALGPVLAVGALADQLPFDINGGPLFQPLASAFVFGLLVAVLFAWWPLMHVRTVTTRELLRERLEPSAFSLNWKGWLGVGVIVVMILGVVFWSSPMPVLSSVFLLGGLVLAFIYFLVGKGLAGAARWMSKHLNTLSASQRLALGHLHRAGSPTGPVVMALGLSLTLLVALDGIERTAERHVATTLPSTAPDLVLFSLPQNRAQDLEMSLQSWDGLESMRVSPFIHARIQSIKGVPVRDLKIPGALNWVVRGDRGVSYVSQIPEGSTLSNGKWWSIEDQSQSLVSIDSGVADKLGLALGDEITLNVSGVSVTGKIVNFRTIDWTGLNLDFPIVTSPGALDTVPHTFAASLKAKPGRTQDLERLMRAEFSELPLIQVDTVLAALSTALDAVIAGLRVAALMTGVAALVVMAGSVLQSLNQRMDEALLFKVLGARRSQLLHQLVVEFLVLGAMVCAVSAPLGLAIASGVAQAAGLHGWHADITAALQLAGIAISITVVVGLLATWGAYAAAPSRYLRRRGL